MGGCFSGAVTGQNDPGATNKTPYSWENREKVDRSLLMVSGCNDQVVSRLPGQLNGRQFYIQQCQGSSVLVLDHTETVTVDKCSDCHILIAPSRGSVFLRNCTNVTCVIACQQFRARDCNNCTVSLLSTTPPVIEASTGVTFSCLQLSYPQLKGLFDSAQLSVFNNCWSSVHDFDGGSSSGNWSVSRGDDPVIIPLPSEGEVADIGVSFSRENSVVPLTVGPKQRPPEEACLVVFCGCDDSDSHAVRLVTSLHDQATIVQTRRTRLQAHEAQRVFRDSQEMADRASKGVVIFLEVSGPECCMVCARAVSSPADSVYVSPTPEQGALDVEAFNSYLDTGMGM